MCGSEELRPEDGTTKLHTRRCEAASPSPIHEGQIGWKNRQARYERDVSEEDDGISFHGVGLPQGLIVGERRP